MKRGRNRIDGVGYCRVLIEEMENEYCRGSVFVDLVHRASISSRPLSSVAGGPLVERTMILLDSRATYPPLSATQAVVALPCAFIQGNRAIAGILGSSPAGALGTWRTALPPSFVRPTGRNRSDTRTFLIKDSNNQTRRHTRFAGCGSCLTHLTVECRRSQPGSGFAGIAESARGSLTAAASHALRILFNHHRETLPDTDDQRPT